MELPATKDLLILAADNNIAYSFKGILERPGELGIRSIRYDFRVHPEHDPGCLLHSQDFLRSALKAYAHALVVFSRNNSCSF